MCSIFKLLQKAQEIKARLLKVKSRCVCFSLFGPLVCVSYGITKSGNSSGADFFSKFVDTAAKEPMQLDLFNSFVHRF